MQERLRYLESQEQTIENKCFIAELTLAIVRVQQILLSYVNLLSDDKIATSSFNHFTGNNMEREGFEQGDKWVRNTFIKGLNLDK